MNYASSCSLASKRRFKNFQNRFLNDVTSSSKTINGEKLLLYSGFVQNAWHNSSKDRNVSKALNENIGC